jgi:tetratricopeptide (TPR) repeat protein
VFNRAGWTLFLTLLLVGTGGVSAEDYAARFKQLRDRQAEGAQIDSLLDEWRAKSSDDPEAWITSANYYFNQSVGPTISTKPAEKGDYGLTDKKTGKKAGSISFKPNVAETSRSATEILNEATRKFPDRLDIWCGLAFIYQESGDFEDELGTLKKMVAYTKAHPTGLKWLKGEPIEEPQDKYIPEKLHDYGLYYEKKENPEDDKRWFAISSLATQEYPNHAEGFNDSAGYYADLRDWKKAREMFEKAHQLDPKSVGVLVNLGNLGMETKDYAMARKYYEEALKADPNGPVAAEAKQALAKMKAKK